MKQTLCILLLVLFWVTTSQQISEEFKVVFPVGVSKTYKYKSLIHSFGGEIQLNNKTVSDDSNSKDGERSEVNADVAVTCMMEWKKINSKAVYLIHFSVSNIMMNMTVDSKNDWKTVSKVAISEQERKTQQKQLEEKFSGFTAATMSSNGKIYKVFHKKDEEAWVTAVKKSIIGQLQTKLSSDQRAEVGGVGNHTSHYQQKKNADGSVSIHKEYSDRDLLQNPSTDGSNHKEMKLESRTDVQLSPTGEVVESTKHDYVNLGSHSTDSPKPFFAERNIPYEEQYGFSTGKSMWMNIEEVSTLTFVKETKVKVSLSEQERNEFIQAANNEDVLDDHPKLKLHPSIVESSLQVHGLEDIAKESRKQRLQQKYNIEELLYELNKDPENVDIAALVKEFVLLDENALDLVHSMFEMYYHMVKDDKKASDIEESKKANF